MPIWPRHWTKGIEGYMAAAVSKAKAWNDANRTTSMRHETSEIWRTDLLQLCNLLVQSAYVLFNNKRQLLNLVGFVVKQRLTFGHWHTQIQITNFKPNTFYLHLLFTMYSLITQRLRLEFSRYLWVILVIISYVISSQLI